MFPCVSDEARKINDAYGAAIMQSVSNCASSAEFQSLDTSQKDRFIKDLKQRGIVNKANKQTNRC